jgi:hypothetical protein
MKTFISQTPSFALDSATEFVTISLDAATLEILAEAIEVTREWGAAVVVCTDQPQPW